jgi:hypothetical protein
VPVMMVLLRSLSHVRRLGWADGRCSMIEGLDAGESTDIIGERLGRRRELELERELGGFREFDLARASFCVRRDGLVVSE